MDEFIDTITRTSILAGLAREDLARVAVAVSVPWWLAIGLIR